MTDPRNLSHSSIAPVADAEPRPTSNNVDVFDLSHRGRAGARASFGDCPVRRTRNSCSFIGRLPCSQTFLHPAACTHPEVEPAFGADVSIPERGVKIESSAIRGESGTPLSVHGIDDWSHVCRRGPR